MTLTKNEIYMMILNLLQEQANQENDGEIDWDKSILDFTDWLENTELTLIIKGNTCD
jgi:hypothetical protein